MSILLCCLVCIYLCMHHIKWEFLFTQILIKLSPFFPFILSFLWDGLIMKTCLAWNVHRWCWFWTPRDVLGRVLGLKACHHHVCLSHSCFLVSSLIYICWDWASHGQILHNLTSCGFLLWSIFAAKISFEGWEPHQAKMAGEPSVHF